MIDISSWVFVRTDGMLLLGLLRASEAMGTKAMLDPVYEWVESSMGVMTPGGPQVISMKGLRAPLGFDSIKRWPVPEGAIHLPVADLSAEERDELTSHVRQFEQNLAQKKSNLIVPNMPPGLASKMFKGAR